MGKPTVVGAWDVLLWDMAPGGAPATYVVRGHVDTEWFQETMHAYLGGATPPSVTGTRQTHIRYIPSIECGEDTGHYHECKPGRGAIAATMGDVDD